MTDNFDAYRAAKQRNEHDAFLDGLGRPAAAEAAPAFVEVANRALDLVSAAHSAGSPRKHGKNNPTWQRGGLLDASDAIPNMLRRLSKLSYEVDGRIFSQDELAEHFDVMWQLERVRREDAERFQKQEDVSRLEKEQAFWDANLLSVACQRLVSGAA